MSIVDLVSEQLKAAMKAKDKPRLLALRGIRAALLHEMKSDGSDTLSDDAAIATLRRLAKQRQDAIDAYSEAGRDDMAADEQAELLVIEAFLPKLADEATTQAWVDQAIEATGASSAKDMGRVMGQLMRDHKNDIDGKLAQQLVKQALS